MIRYILLFVFTGCLLAASAQQKVRHVSDQLNCSGNSTFIDAAGLNGNPRAIIIVEYDAAVRAANPHPVGVWYDGSRWALFNQDRAAMPAGLTFDLTWKNEDDKAFVFRSNKGRNQLDHPLLNNQPEARFYVSQVWNPGGAGGVYNNAEISVQYNRQTNKWQIVNTTGTPLPAGSAFNVLIVNERPVNGTVISTLPALSATDVLNILKKDSVRFRVTINGFTCHRATADHILEVDGKGDEIFAGGVTQYFNAVTGERTGTAQRSWSLRAGDINSDDARWGMRVRAGSKPGGFGGIQSGDQFPAIEPWKRQAPVDKKTFPLLLTEGVLVKGETAAMIVPSIWEYDGTTEEEQQLNNFASTFAQVSVFFATNVPFALLTGGASIPFVTIANAAAFNEIKQYRGGQPADNLPLFARLNYNLPEFNVIVNKTLFGDAKDRPIGMEDKGKYFDYSPLGIYLTYENANAIRFSDYGYGLGILPVRFKDPADMQGDYTLYLQVEVVDGAVPLTNPDEIAGYGENNRYFEYKIANLYSANYLGANSTGAYGTINPSLSRWRFEKVPGAVNSWYYYLVSETGQYLAVMETEASRNNNGYAPLVSTRQAKSTHYWRVISNSDGTYTLLNVFAQKALVQGGPALQVLLWENRANPEQRWKIQAWR